MKKLNYLICLILSLCFLCSCGGNNVVSTPDSADSSKDLITDIEVNSQESSAVQAEDSLRDNNTEESSLPEEDDPQEPTFSMDKVAWYPDENGFYLGGIEITPCFSEGENLSKGLLKQVAENSDKDVWYPVYMKVSDFFYEYGCVVDEEYTKNWKAVLGLPADTPDPNPEKVICYVTPQLISELLQSNYRTWHTWMPRPENAKKLWYEANGYLNPDILDNFSMDKVIWYSEEEPFDNQCKESQYPPKFEEIFSYGLADNIPKLSNDELWWPDYSENPDKDVWYAVYAKVYDYYDKYGCIVDEEYTEKWKSLCQDMGVDQYADDETDSYKVCYISPKLFWLLEFWADNTGYYTFYTWMPHPDNAEEMLNSFFAE